MTPQERAEEIAKFLDKTPLNPDGIALIAAQIEEAEREAVRRAIIGSFTKEYELKRLEGYAQGIEDSAKIAETWVNTPTERDISEEIRSLIKPGEGGAK